MTRGSTVLACCLRNNDGAVLVTALLMMVVLSLMSSFAMTVSMLEQKVTGTSEVFQHNFYAAEGVLLAGVTAVDLIEDQQLWDKNFPGWLKKEEPDPKDRVILLDQSDQWDQTNTEITPQATAYTQLIPAGYAEDGTENGDRIWYAALDLGSCADSGLNDQTEQQRCYEVYGMYDVKRGWKKAYAGRRQLMVKITKTIYQN